MASIEITPISKQKPIYNNLVKYVLNKVDDSFINKLTIINEEINLIKKTTVQKAEFGEFKEFIEEDRNKIILNLYDSVGGIERVNKLQDEKIKTLEAGGVHEVFYYDLLDLIESNSLIPNHVYKLLDYRVYLDRMHPEVYGKFVSISNRNFIIYLTASSANTFFKEARIEFAEGVLEKEFLGDKLMVCHYSPYRTGKLPYTLLSNPYDDIINMNRMTIKYESELEYQGYWITVFSTTAYTRSNNSDSEMLFKKYLAMLTKLRVSLEKDPDSYIMRLIREFPEDLFAFVEGFTGDELPKDWYNYVEKDSYGDLIFSYNIHSYMIRYSEYRGEITWMRDDLGNEAPYDFYNILHCNVYNEGLIFNPELSEMDFTGYFHKKIALGFINDYSSMLDVLLTPGRVRYKNNIAKSLYSTIIDNGDIGASNNVLDCCVLYSGVSGCSNNIVGKSPFPIIFGGSNNIIHDNSYIITTDLNYCDIFFKMNTLSPFVMPPLYFCKLRGSAFLIASYKDSPVWYTEFNGDMKHTPNSQFLLPQKSIIDVYLYNGEPILQVDRNKQGVFNIIDIKGVAHIYIFKKGQTWLEWLAEIDYCNGIVSRPIDKSMLGITTIDGSHAIIYNGASIKREGTSTFINPTSVILEDTYSVPPSV